MSDEPMPPAVHPEGELAAYVGGSASPLERALVEQHLVSCASCRSDVRLARAARAALLTLPTLEPPGIAASLSLPEEEPARGAVVSLDARRSRGRWQRMSAALAAAAAASVVAIALVLRLAGGTMSPASRPAAGADRSLAQEGAPAGGTNYTAQSLAALAERLRSPTPSPVPLFGGQNPVATLPLDKARTSSSLTESACLRGAAGMPQSVPLSFFQLGSFEGTPAYIGAFQTGTGDNARLLVLAVSRDGCRALDVISEKV
jgi:hypothetical protein